MADKTIFSFFSGCGILDLGFEYSGFNIEFVNEFSPSFINAYKFSRQKLNMKEPLYGYANTDINIYLNEKKEELACHIQEERAKGNLVGFIGGPPCPDFSVAGKQRGRDGDNGKLSLSYVNVILNHKPDFFLFENVKGLWRTARHREFYEELKGVLSEAGYVLFDRLTNALEFGVPQDRDRILLVGIKRELLPEEVPEFPWKRHMLYELDKLKNIPWPDMTPYKEDSRTKCPAGIPEELTVQYCFEKNHVETHPDAKRYFTPKAGIEKMKVIAEGDTYKKSYKRIHRWRYSPTACYGNNEVHLHPYHTRRLSVAEVMAIQSLPEGFCLPPEMTLTDCFKTLGNGVPFLLAKGIADTLGDYLDEVIK